MMLAQITLKLSPFTQTKLTLSSRNRYKVNLKTSNHQIYYKMFRLIGYRGYKRNADGTRVLAVENGEHSLYDIIEEIRDMQLNELEKGGR